MATPKYIFTSSNGQLRVVLDNGTSDFVSNESYEFRSASANLYDSKSIEIFDFGVFEKSFLFENIKTIGGATPTDISDAYTLILELIPSNSVINNKRTYRTAFVVTPATTPTDVFQLIGSATTKVEVNKIILSGTMTTAGMADVYISKRSTANTLGTSSASVNVPMVSTDAAATAVGAIYTANPTTGTSVGDVYIQSIPFATTTDKTNNIVEIDFGERGKPVILSGVAQALAINLNGATLTGLNLKVTVEFTEY